MPVSVAAVKLKKSRRHGSQSHVDSTGEEEPQNSAAEDEVSHPTAGAQDEKSCIKKNLEEFYTEFESQRERGILKKAPPVCRRAISSQAAPMEQERPRHSPTGMDEGGMSPLSPGLQKGTPILIPNGVEKSFKSRRSFNSRLRDVEDIVRKHPNKVPIIVERKKSEKFLGILDKSKFLVPQELTMSQLSTIIRRRLQLMDTQAFYLIVNKRSMASASMTLSEVYRTEKDSDGFLYITYASQEMFG